MDIKDFINNFADQFEDTDINEFTSETNFKELDEWTSFIALSVIGMTYEEYGISIDGDDIRKSNTIQDLFNIIESRT